MTVGDRISHLNLVECTIAKHSAVPDPIEQYQRRIKGAHELTLKNWRTLNQGISKIQDKKTEKTNNLSNADGYDMLASKMKSQKDFFGGHFTNVKTGEERRMNRLKNRYKER